MLAPEDITLAVGVLAGFGSSLFFFSVRRQLASRFMACLLGLVAMMYGLRYAILTQSPLAPLLIFPAIGLAWFHGPLLELYVRTSFFEADNLRLRRELAPAAIAGALAVAMHAVVYTTTDWVDRVEPMHFADAPFRRYFAGVILAIAAFCSYNLWQIYLWARAYGRRYREYRAGSAAAGLREMYAFLILCAAWLATPLVTEILVGVLGPGRPWFLLPVSGVAFVPLLFLALRRAMAGGERLPDMDSPSLKPERGSRSQLTPERLEEIVGALRESLADDRAHLNEDLSLMELARDLGVSRHHLSEAISAGFGTNFYGLINRYRVAEARELLRDPDLAEETILNIAYRSGFRSKAVFNRVFKTETGSTPGEYRQAADASFGQKKPRP